LLIKEKVLIKSAPFDGVVAVTRVDHPASQSVLEKADLTSNYETNEKFGHTRYSKGVLNTAKKNQHIISKKASKKAEDLTDVKTPGTTYEAATTTKKSKHSARTTTTYVDADVTASKGSYCKMTKTVVKPLLCAQNKQISWKVIALCLKISMSQVFRL